MVTDHHLSTLPLDQLLADCLAGKRSKQKLLYNYFAPRMFGICLRYASDLPQDEDILQEGFIKVFNNLDRFRGDGSFEGWIKRIFINTAIEHYRKSSRRQLHIEISEQLDIGFDSNVLQQLAADDIIKLIQQLPDGYRTVFNLYSIEGYSHREIGKMLGISEGTSKSQLSRARMQLQTKINTLK